ncbi:hypothetical protein [Streptomyces cavernae]|uniref:hypothetical protein n=1 Tax=Streptomyces cavernae TaxID=2259034 RepID=UPI000FEC1147|nr:hypothetical protein [Streptomyces cavernae]
MGRTTGPLSWQQEYSLRWESEYGPNETLYDSFVVPGLTEPGAVIDRVEELAANADVLRIVEAKPGDPQPATYSDRLEAPREVVRCTSPDDVGKAVREHHSAGFDAAGPRWTFAVIEHPDETGRTVNTLSVLFDHLLADAHSMTLFRSRMLSGVNTEERTGHFQEWVRAQRQEFDPTAPNNPARQFWLRTLDGASPYQGINPEVFGEGDGAHLGSIHINTFSSLSLTTLNELARRLKATPFVILLAVATATAAELTGGAPDLVIRSQNSGRTHATMNTLGSMATGMPFRLRHPQLECVDSALQVARAAWSDALRYYHTPWLFIETVSASTGVQDTAEDHPQLILNFFPREISGIGEQHGEDGEVSYQVSENELYVYPIEGGGLLLRLTVNLQHTSLRRAREFLSTFASRLKQLAEAA